MLTNTTNNQSSQDRFPGVIYHRNVTQSTKQHQQILAIAELHNPDGCFNFLALSSPTNYYCFPNDETCEEEAGGRFFVSLAMFSQGTSQRFTHRFVDVIAVITFFHFIYLNLIHSFIFLGLGFSFMLCCCVVLCCVVVVLCCCCVVVVLSVVVLLLILFLLLMRLFICCFDLIGSVWLCLFRFVCVGGGNMLCRPF